MMIITLQVWGTPKPELSVHGDIVKVDFGALLIEMDRGSFKDLMVDLALQAAKHGIKF